MEGSRQGRSSPSRGEHGDHIIALRWRALFLGMLFTVNLLLYKEIAILFQAGATIGAHITFRAAMPVPQLHKRANNTSATFVTHDTSERLQPTQTLW